MVRKEQIEAWFCELGGRNCDTFLDEDVAKAHQEDHERALKNYRRAKITELLNFLALKPLSLEPAKIDWRHEEEEERLPAPVAEYFGRHGLNVIGVKVEKASGHYWFSFGPLIASIFESTEIPQWKVSGTGSRIKKMEMFVKEIQEKRGFEEKVHLLRALVNITMKHHLLEEKNQGKLF